MVVNTVRSYIIYHILAVKGSAKIHALTYLTQPFDLTLVLLLSQQEVFILAHIPAHP